ncbi:hypothetical protein [Nocardia sp. XZ_19_385]|uniref:hypothetical protein n=1 Tax=Nocardia sp. XZ_19_385 TaxID=2769488 RepID=UPI00188FE496|nr:hypothetical protein [Nocardia sp. XZ_19_385]
MTLERFSEKQRTAGTDTAKVRDRMNGLADRVQTQLDNLIAIVRSDPVFGSKFMDDAKGLKYQLEGAVEGTRTMAASWGKLSDGQFEAARNNEIEEKKREAQILEA